jgi:hypothetical protein
MGEAEAEQGPEDARVLALAARRSLVGLPPLPPEGLGTIAASLAAETPLGRYLDRLLALGEEIGGAAPADDFAAWAAAAQRLEALAYALRLIEAQIIAGNHGPGLLLPDRNLYVGDSSA